MKKFFKALALVLALTLVIGTIPASAAIDFELKKTSKIIYIDGSKGTAKDADGNVVKCKTVNKYTVTKLIKGFDADTMDVKITTADKTIASKNNKYDRVYAKGIGTTTATIKIYYKDDLKSDIGTLKLKVKVKKNATDLPYYVADADLNLIDVDADYVFACNTDYYIVLNRYAYLDPADLTKKVKVDTDKRALTGKEDEVDIVAGGKAGNIFKVNFKKAGTITLKASAYQSAKFDQPTVEKEITVKAGYTALAVAQASLNKAVVTFAQPVAKGNLANDNFKLYTKIADTERTESTVKGITYDETEKEKVYVEFNSNFAADKEYFVSYNGKEIGSFKAIKVTADSVKFIELVPNQEFEVNTTGTLKFVLLDENRIDITAAYPNGVLNGTIEAKLADNTDTTSNIWGTDIVLGKVDTSYDVNISYSWYDSTGIQQKVEGAGVVRCIAKKVWEQVSFKGAITKVGGEPIFKDGAVNAKCTTVAHFAVGDNDLQLQAAVGFTLKGTTKYDIIDDKNYTINTTEPYAYISYRAEAGDPNVCMVTKEDVNGVTKYNRVHATGEGTTDIVIYGTKVDANNNYVEEVVGSVPVKVEAARKVTQFKVNPSKTTLNQAFVEDSIGFDLVVLDQYGEELDGKKVTIQQIFAANYAGPKVADAYVDEFGYSGYLMTVGVKSSSNTNVKEFTLAQCDIEQVKKDGKVVTATLVLEFTCEGLKYRVSNIDCGWADKADRQQIKLSATELKTGIVTKTEATFDDYGDQTFSNKGIYISLTGLAKNKYAATGAAVEYVEKAEVLKESDTLTFGSNDNFYMYTLKKDNVLVKRADVKNFWWNYIGDVEAEEYSLNASGTAIIASGSAIKAPAGTYTVDLYEYRITTGNDGKKIATPYLVDTKNFKVVDDQAGLTFTTKTIEGLGDVNLDNEATLRNCFEFKFNGAVVTDVKLNYTVTGDGSQARVASAEYIIKNVDKGNFKVTVNVGVVIRK